MHRLFDGHACRVGFLFSGTYQIAARKLSNERCALQLASNFVQHILISQHPKGIKKRSWVLEILFSQGHTHTRGPKRRISKIATPMQTKKNRIWLSLGTHRAPLGALQQQIINANPDPVCLFFLNLLSLLLLEFRPKLDLPKSAKLPVDSDRL